MELLPPLWEMTMVMREKFGAPGSKTYWEKIPVPEDQDREGT